MSLVKKITDIKMNLPGTSKDFNYMTLNCHDSLNITDTMDIKFSRFGVLISREAWYTDAVQRQIQQLGREINFNHFEKSSSYILLQCTVTSEGRTYYGTSNIWTDPEIYIMQIGSEDIESVRYYKHYNIVSMRREEERLKKELNLWH